jgi:hypothetical protein
MFYECTSVKTRCVSCQILVENFQFYLKGGKCFILFFIFYYFSRGHHQEEEEETTQKITNSFEESLPI